MIGLDLAKNVFQIHGVDASGAVVLRRQLRRGQVEKFFAQQAPTLVGMEACAGAHHWARVIGRLGHQVRVMPPSYVKPYVKRNKNDGRDAEAICEAMSRPSMRFVAVKSVEQQASLAVHTTRALLVRQRTQAANALRAGLNEIGMVAAQGVKGLRQLMQQLETPSADIPEVMRGALLLLAQQWERLDAAERALEGKIKKAALADQAARRLIEVPTVGPITASATVAKAALQGRHGGARRAHRAHHMGLAHHGRTLSRAPAGRRIEAGQGALICRKGQSWRDGKWSGTEIETPRAVIACHSASE
jgi:transposase